MAAAEVTAYSSTCAECGQHCDWIESHEGGWWAHREATCRQVTPDGRWTHDHHAPRIDWEPMQNKDRNGNWETA